MEAPGRVRESQPHFVLPPNLYMRPPVRGTFWFQIFIQAPSPEIWSKRFSGGEEVLAGKWGGLFLRYLLGKNFRRRDRDQLSFRSEAREASGNETPSSEPGAPSFQCRDVYQDCTPTHLHWFRTGMTDVPFAAVSGDALAAYSRCRTMSAVGNLKTPRQSALSSRRLFCCFEVCRISPRPTGKQTP